MARLYPYVRNTRRIPGSGYRPRRRAPRRKRNRNAGYRKRKRVGYRSRRRGRTGNAFPPLYNRIFGSTRTVTLRYIDHDGIIAHPQYNPTYGQSYRVNSPWDPVWASGGQSAHMFSEFERVYGYYEVLAYRVVCTFYTAPDANPETVGAPVLVGLNTEPHTLKNYNGAQLESAKMQAPWKFKEQHISTTLFNGKSRFTRIRVSGTPAGVIGNMRALGSTSSRPNHISNISGLPQLVTLVTPYARAPLNLPDIADEPINYRISIDYKVKFWHARTVFDSNTTTSLTDDWDTPATVVDPGSDRDP